jgi:antitoxin ParD1/3/4
MGKNTSILLGDYFESYVNQKISSGKYSSVSEVIRSALRLLESEETKTKNLINELKIGEKSGIAENFNRNENLKDLHARHINK